MIPTKQQLIDAMEHISFEMNRYLYTANPIVLPGRYREIVSESCLLHSRNVGEFFFGKMSNHDIRVNHYYEELISKDELQAEINKSQLKWDDYKRRANKKLCHLTFSRLDSMPMHMQEKNDLNFEILINLFEKNLPIDFKEKWDLGKSFSV